MRYYALATDYDGTIAAGGRVSQATLESLRRWRAAGGRLILVTGRDCPDLSRVLEHWGDFDQIVAENGAVLFRPASGEERILAEPPPAHFATLLRERGVSPLAIGRVIVATTEPHETVVLQTIRELGLELQVIFNKGAVMVLPSGVNKATGLKAALVELGLSAEYVVGVGDAENDHAFLEYCGYSVAVANALPALKDRANWITSEDHGEGVAELIDRLIAGNLPPPRSVRLPVATAAPRPVPLDPPRPAGVSTSS